MKQETQNELERFRDYLREQEKSSHTIEKYCRDVRKFLMFADEDWDKNTIISFKEYLQAHYKTSSANSMLASLNSYFHFIGRQEYCVRTFRVQKRIFCDERREMTRSDYQKLVKAARERGDERLCAILQTIASTGIRISELSYITAESLAQGEVVIDCKGKQRVILLPQSLMLYLTQYCRKQRIVRGSIFVTRSGQAVRRQNVAPKLVFFRARYIRTICAICLPRYFTSAITIWSVWQTIWVTAAWKRQDVIRSSAAVKRAADSWN